MAATPKQAASQEDVEAAVSSLTREDLLRLDKIARTYTYGRRELARDVFQESIYRILRGTRPWPQNVAFLAFVAGVMRSVADGLLTGGASDIGRQALLDSDLPRDENDQSSPVENYSQHQDSLVERQLITEETLNELEEIFSDDEVALTVVMGRADNMSRKEIEKEFGLTTKQYDSASKKIWRRLRN